jgi:hypothetical protein
MMGIRNVVVRILRMRKGGVGCGEREGIMPELRHTHCVDSP